MNLCVEIPQYTICMASSFSSGIDIMYARPLIEIDSCFCRNGSFDSAYQAFCADYTRWIRNGPLNIGLQLAMLELGNQCNFDALRQKIELMKSKY
jgi:hypothetical protein